MSDALHIALAGTPNSGKSSLFNLFTGEREKVANYPGVTVEEVKSVFELDDGRRVNITDLPGTYSLYPHSEDERVVLNQLLDQSKGRFDFILYVADATNLSKSLLLLTQLADLGWPLICALNQIDAAGEEGLQVDPEKLSDELGVPVIPVNAKENDGIDQLKSQLLSGGTVRREPFHDVEAPVAELHNGFDDLSKYGKYVWLNTYHHLLDLPDEVTSRADEFTHELNRLDLEVQDKLTRANILDEITSRVTTIRKQEESRSDRLDKVLTHPVWGSFIFVTILFLIFQALFTLASYPMDWIDAGMGAFAGWIGGMLPDGMINSFVVDGVLAGVAGILVFIPQIAILFGFIAIMEESGYMARAVYLSDKIMVKSGLNGRSIVALISGVACAVPAIMATRNISNRKERLITIFTTPFMSCSARLPVYVVLSALVVPDGYVWGVFNKQGLVMFGMYGLGTFAALGTSWLISRFVKSSAPSTLLMELPAYRVPVARTILLTMYDKAKVFVLNAGKIIIIIAMVLWVLASFGPGDAMKEAETVAIEQGTTIGLSEVELNNLVAARRLEASYAGLMGKTMEPVIEPLGFDWKIGIALVTSFAAREVFVGTMATIYSIGTEEDDQTIIETLRSQRNPETGELSYTPAKALSLLIFYVFAMQCMSTLAIVKKETESWGIALAQFVFMTLLAYLASYATYSILA